MTGAGFPSRGCPICGGAPGRTFFRQQFAEIEHATPITGYDVVTCERCGCAYADGIPEQAALDRYYREMSKYEYAQRSGAESDYDRRRLALIADLIAPRLGPQGARILDVGCASGRLLSILRGLGFVNVAGLDPSPACAATAARLYAIDVRTDTLETLADSGDRYDVVILVGVLEHLRDLAASLDHVRHILTSDGLIYVEVPDVTAFADWDNAPYQDFSTEHINFFSPMSLVNLMRVHGFSPEFLEQNHREQSYRTVMSNISAFFRMGPAPTALPHLESDEASAQGLERYLERSAAEDVRLRARIDAVVADGRPILIWGVGTHTGRLMATSALADANITAFIESNARYHGKTLHGRPIVPPSSLRDHRDPVLVSSRVFQREIVDQIRDDLHCQNELILLYHD